MDRRRAAAALLALAACIACSAAAPTASNHTALELHDGPVEGCYYNFQHYGEGDRIMTNEPCLNCTCHNRMLMCYLRVCPFTKAIGQDCTVEKRADQCCPIVTCPDVPVDLLTSTSTSSPAEYGATGLGRLDKYGCTVHGKYFPEGAKVPPTPNKPCEHCYCIRNMTTCVMQECTLHVDGCTPIYHKDVCCPVRYSCDHPEDEVLLLDDMTTTVRPTPGFLLTTTTMSPVTQMSQDCVHDDQIFPDGALIKTEKACEHCYCMKGDIVCVVQECGTPMENEGKNCTSLPPRHGQCCPDTYICEGDERTPDSTTEIVELTSSPPRRVGVEGSGYRNEPDEPYTEVSPLTTEIEGSGEEYITAPQIDTGDNVTPEKETPQIIDETLLTTTETSLQFSQSTEPDKGQNTIPDSVIDNETPQDKVTLSSFATPLTTISEEYTTTKDLVTPKDELSTVESTLKGDDESVPHKTSTPKDVIFEDEQVTTEFTDLLEKTTYTDVKISHKEDKEATTTPSVEYTDKVQETSKEEEMSTESIGLSTTVKVTEKDIISKTSPETVIESTTYSVTNSVVAESTSVNPNVNEVDDNVSPNLSPSRIPGEGDCLLNGVTYTNDTNVPSTNNCHTGCKCISSIIKCDPIICSPPPEYMENMNDCQPIYDTPNSCCPTYVCSVKETVPPESHSHMSGTESPKPVTASECVGNDCIESEEMKPPTEPITCTSGDCLSETPSIQKCKTDDCKEQTDVSPILPSQDCYDGKCQLPVVPCQGEDCKIEPSKNDISDKDLQSTKSPAMQECDSNDCTNQIQSKPQDCSDGKCEVLPAIPCEGDNCKPLESSSHDAPICDKENGCEESNVIVQDECVGESCKRKDVTEVGGKVPFKCSGSECKLQDEPNIKPDHVTEMIYEGTTVSDKDLQKTESLESQTTTSKDKLTESDKNVTKQSMFTEPPEKLSTSSEQIVTEPPQKHDTENELLQTGGPVIEAFTKEPEEVVTKTEIMQPESPKLPTAETTESQDTYTHTEERFTTETDLPVTKETAYVEVDTEKSIDLSHTKVPEFAEIETEKYIPGENEQVTLKPQISTDSRETVSDEQQTKSPQTTGTESEKPVTVVPILTVTENEGVKTEETETKPSETSNVGSDSTEASMLEGTQTTLLKEKEIVHDEVSGLDKERDEIVTRSPELILTDKEVLQTEMPETFTLGVDIQTQAPETLTTEKEAIEAETIKVTTAEKEEVQTDIPDILTPVRDITSTEYPDQSALQTTSSEMKGTTKETIEIEGQEAVTTEESQTKAPVTSATKSEDDQKHITEIATEKEVFGVSTPERHDEELEFTTVHEFSQAPMEGQIITLRPETDESDSSRVTEEPSIKPQAAITEIPVVTTEEKEYDESHKLKPIIPVSETTEGTAAIVTESLSYETVTDRLESDITKMVSQPGASVTESISYPTKPEEIGEITTKETQVVTEEQKGYTESPQEIVTKSEEKQVTTGEELLYTNMPDDVTKSEGDDDAVTQSQEMLTKLPDFSATEYVKESSITEKEEKNTESPETYLTTKVPQLYTTLAENILTEKPYTTAADIEKHEKDKLDSQTTPENIEKLATTISNQITERPDTYSTEPQQQNTSTDQKLDSQYPYSSTMIEEEEQQKTTDSLNLVTEIGKIPTDPTVLVEEKQHDSSTKLPGEQKTTETYEEIITDKLTTQYTQELTTESHHTLSQEAIYTKSVTDSYQETSTKTIQEEEKESQDQQTTTRSQTTESGVKMEEGSTLSITEKPDSNIVTEKYPGTLTTEGEEKVTQLGDEEEITKLDEKISDMSEESGLHESHLPEHTAMDSSTTQSSLEISTDKKLLSDEDIDNNKKPPGELSTEVPSSITELEQSISSIIDRVTTEPQNVFTSSDADKVSTTILDKEVQKEQTSDSDSYLMTTLSSQTEDITKVTESPMSLITHVDNVSSYHTTLSAIDEIAEQESKTTVLPKLDDEKLQTSPPETHVTESEKESTESPYLHVTQQTFDTENSSKFGIEDSNILIADKATTTIEEEYGSDVKTTVIPNQQYDFSKDVPGNVITESTSSSDTQKVTIETSQWTTTTSVPEKESDVSHEQETLITVSVDEHETKSPYEISTDMKDITTVSSILKDDKNVIETVDTEVLSSEQQVTEHPAEVYDMHTISPEKETTGTGEVVITETPKLSTEKQSEADTPINVPTFTELTESPISVVTEIKELDVTEKVDKPTETVLQPEEASTAHVDLETGTEKDVSYSQTVPSADITELQHPVTQQKESSTTNVPDRFTITTQSVPRLPEQEEHGEHGASDSLTPQITTQVPETITLLTETQTESSDMETVEIETSKPIDAEIQPILPDMQSNIGKESSTTEATTILSKETETEVINVETHTRITPTISEIAQTTQPNKDYGQSEEPTQTTESVHEFSETTPFLVELKEHTHQVVDESPRTPTEEIPTTSVYEPEQTERGDQNLDVTDKYEEEHRTSSPVYQTEHDHEDKEKLSGQDQTEQEIPTTNPPEKDVSEGPSDTEAVSKTPSTYPQTDLHDTSTIQDIVVTTTAAPQAVSEKELYTTVSTDEQKLTYPAPETSSIPTEKDIHLGTEVPLKPDVPIGTTVLDDDSLQETSKSTTSEIKDITTPSPSTDKPTQPEEKPIRTTISPSTQELTKPAFDDEINEGIPPPDFPPSGAGGYGQEPDYIEEDQAFGPGTCRYGGKVYVSAQQIPRDDPCDFCFCFRSDIICLQQSCPPPIHGCHEEPIQGFCCPRYECPVSMATTLNVTTTTTTTTTTLPPHFLPHAYKGQAQRRGCQIKGHTYKVGEVVRASSGPCLHCTCGGDGQMKCDPKACTPEPMLRQMIAAAVSAKRRR